MSVINCSSCARAVDTDFDVETILDQPQGPTCVDCAEFQCFDYRVLIHDNTWFSGQIKAYTAAEALERVQYMYSMGNQKIEVTHAGRWSTFQRLLDGN